MLEQNPVWREGLASVVSRWGDHKGYPCKLEKGRNGKCYVVSCGVDDGDVSVSVFDSEDELVELIDRNLRDARDSGIDLAHPDTLRDAVSNAVYSGWLVTTSLWG